MVEEETGLIFEVELVGEEVVHFEAELGALGVEALVLVGVVHVVVGRLFDHQVVEGLRLD